MPYRTVEFEICSALVHSYFKFYRISEIKEKSKRLSLIFQYFPEVGTEVNEIGDL